MKYPRLTSDRKLNFFILLILNKKMFDISVLHLFNGVNSVPVVM